MKNILTYVLEVLSESPYSEGRFLALDRKRKKTAEELVEYEKLKTEREWDDNIEGDKEAVKLIEHYIGDLKKANIQEMDIFIGVMVGCISTHMEASQTPEKTKNFVKLLTRTAVKMKNKLRDDTTLKPHA